MDGVLSIVAVIVGLLVVGWVCAPADQRGPPGRRDRDQDQAVTVESEAGRNGR